ncbi:MAG TPA: peptide-methionine (R)-S-oxide reductase MsrB [Patescibacteria group bacterium]|jgi:peptide-methionine (R)-S-oxide reductase|nr:peptide-methionine (R)-S-oxide reductase MsrB [Patescibacteria group bacterium]
MKQINQQLTDQQKAVLFDKATEAPFSGELLHNDATGVYRCANCDAELFRSGTKFDSGSGWPSFDDALPGSVTFIDDESHGMIRTEIACAKCGAHLGHIFPDGPKDTTGMRYCVNSLSLNFTETNEQK